MTRSMLHRNTRDKFSHYLCPLHLMGPMVRCSVKTRSKVVKKVLTKFLKGYDLVYRVIFVAS